MSPKKILHSKIIPLPQVSETLKAIGEENLDQFQRRSLDYAAKFSKADASAIEEILKKLTEEFGLGEEEAVQVVNCMPESIEEIRPFLGGGRRIIETSRLEGILNLLNKYRKQE